MYFDNYITVFNNIPKNFSYLVGDFIGFELHTDKIISIIINILIAFIFIAVYYLIGRKIRLFFFKNINYINFNNFINVALGYIFVNSALAILGLFSLLYSTVLWAYIITVLFISIYPFSSFRNSMVELCNAIRETKRKVKENKWVFFGVILFVFIAFLRLIPPEIGEDAIGYHTSDSYLFLKNHTTVLKHSYVAMPAPHLGEMTYVLSEFVGLKDSTRYVHFSFYFLVAFLLILVNPYAALFFVTAPVVIQISSKANVDFQWILCWLLSILILSQNSTKKVRKFILIGILFGGVLASKLWTIAFFPLFVLYLLIIYRKLRLAEKFKITLAFFLPVFLIDLVWLWRSYIITGDPVFPGGGSLGINNLIGFNKLMFHMQNISVFSPLFYFGIVILLLHWRYSLKILLKFNLSLFFIILTTEYLLIQYHFGRYLLGLYSLMVLIISAAINSIFKKYNIYKIVFIPIFGVMFIYYFINTLLILPYGFGWADENRYLTRVLFRDNSSYYDFDHLFNKWISSEDKVATHGIFGYYYADFDYIDTQYIFGKGNKSFDLLAKQNVTKLLIKGGDIFWFCKSLSLKNCSSSKIKLLASYPEGIGKYNLYGMVKIY
ncbi:MAG: hypothetical protein Q8P29_00625 [Candidatus Levybacteria bacterium]|nr:hypothetical protein [Candidatus Levybacteria bacterium]